MITVEAFRTSIKRSFREGEPKIRSSCVPPARLPARRLGKPQTIEFRWPVAAPALQQRLNTKAKATIAPAMIKPRTPTRRSLFIMTPTRLRMKPSGVATMIVNPPRVVRGDPQPGWNSSIAASAPKAASEKHRPIRPKPALRAIIGSAWMIGGCSIFERLKLHLDRLAGRLQGLKVELDVHGDFLASQVLGYSP